MVNHYSPVNYQIAHTNETVGGNRFGELSAHGHAAWGKTSSPNKNEGHLPGFVLYALAHKKRLTMKKLQWFKVDSRWAEWFSRNGYVTYPFFFPDDVWFDPRWSSKIRPKASTLLEGIRCHLQNIYSPKVEDGTWSHDGFQDGNDLFSGVDLQVNYG